MSYQEKRAIVSLISTLVINAFYWLYMAQRYPSGDDYSPDVFRFWGSAFLILIAVSIIVKIIVYIIFTIVNVIARQETEPSITDERDRLIELKSTRNSFYAFMLLMVVALASLAISMPPSVMFVLLILAGIASEIVSEVSQFYFYRRGF
jgi:hypothetical protein